MANSASSPVSRRDFLKTSAAATGVTAGLMASGNFAYASGSDVIRVGLVGCGGRGIGAARDCAESAEGVQIVALGDLFQDRLEARKEPLREAIGDAYQVKDDHCFTGFDNYKHVIDSDIDLVILATPPAFRPMHMQYAAEAGKHMFIEKPISVDAAGTRSALKTAELIDEKGLSVTVGTLYRRQLSFMEGVKQVHDGAIGDITAGHAYYLTGPIWLRPRKPGMSDMEWQCRNWYYFEWLSGDHIVEQFVHNLDVLNWVFGGPPVSCIGSGGRQARVAPSYGHIYDHFSIEYVFENGARVTAMCRQYEQAHYRVQNRIIGTKGIADLNPDHSIIRNKKGKVTFEYPEKGNNGYVQEHTDLITSIRENKPINETKQLAYSTLTAIMGREAAYTGQELTMEQVLNANQNLLPMNFHFGSLSVPAVPTPGITQLERSYFTDPTSLAG